MGQSNTPEIKPQPLCKKTLGKLYAMCIYFRSFT